MALNKNHEFEDLDGVRCGIVEKNVTPERVAFLKELLEFNKYSVVTVPSPPPKVAPAPKPKEGEEIVEPAPAPPPAPETFTVGVTDYTFNPINAIFGRMLKTKNGHIVTLAYWEQKEAISNDEIPYFE
ncbi:MAG: hypothetical protein KBF82_05975 [Chitinophagaceae bacterium]|nr:hypothetical protein [Chitinophagaceae bacterium]